MGSSCDVRGVPSKLVSLKTDREPLSLGATQVEQRSILLQRSALATCLGLRRRDYGSSYHCNLVLLWKVRGLSGLGLKIGTTLRYLADECLQRAKNTPEIFPKSIACEGPAKWRSQRHNAQSRFSVRHDELGPGSLIGSLTWSV